MSTNDKIGAIVKQFPDNELHRIELGSWPLNSYYNIPLSNFYGSLTS